ncbi:hypothetical protein L218DRAFT_1002737 [Marasmius fiardii PR-910]|nr:hypothetical protein L218DRAFT_1002737 [Marasmius fiardii PR-910]
MTEATGRLIVGLDVQHTYGLSTTRATEAKSWFWRMFGAELEGGKFDQFEKDIRGLEEPKLELWLNNHILHKRVDQKMGQRVRGVTNSSSYIYVPPSDSSLVDAMDPLETVLNRLVASEVVVLARSVSLLPPFLILIDPICLQHFGLYGNAIVCTVLECVMGPETKTGRLADYDYVTEYGKLGTGNAPPTSGQ